MHGKHRSHGPLTIGDDSEGSTGPTARPGGLHSVDGSLEPEQRSVEERELHAVPRTRVRQLSAAIPAA